MATEAYLLLAAVTMLLAVLVWLVWLRTRSVGFVAGIALLYYWSVYGAWQLVGDLTHPTEPRRYQYLLGKMFGVNLDIDYVSSLVGYGVFLVTVALAVLVVAGRKRPEVSVVATRILHERLIWGGIGSIAAAVVLIRGQLVEAVALGLSGYSVTAAGGAISPWFTLHQTFNTIAVVPAAIGVPVLLSGERGRFLVGRRTPAICAAYALYVGILFVYGILLGNKAELFFGAIAAVVLYSLNSPRPRWSGLVLCAVVVLAAMGVVDYARSLTVSELSGGVSGSKVAEAVGAIANSNEAYAAHFSLYGVMHYKVPLTWGTSIVSLAAAAIPRALWPSRPGTVYEHYAAHLGMVDGQGYTLHHATGWYLNFGWAGILFGGLVLGGFWAATYRLIGRQSGRRGRERVIASVVAFSFVTGYLPSLVRVGLEGYKSVIAFAVVIPILVIFSAGKAERAA